VSGFKKSRLDHDGNQKRCTANVENDGPLARSRVRHWSRLCRLRSVKQMT